MRRWVYIVLLAAAVGCHKKQNVVPVASSRIDTVSFSAFSGIPPIAATEDSSLRQKIIAFAKTQIGTPYKYCSMMPGNGFDCSGFVSYVFNHFNVQVPRSSVDFTNFGEDVPLAQAQPGDVILFTGTNPHSRIVGHVGIIVTNINDSISFIQSTSGAAYGVVISPLDENYLKRFVKVVRVVH